MNKIKGIYTGTLRISIIIMSTADGKDTLGRVQN